MAMNNYIDELHEAFEFAKAKGCRNCMEMFYTLIGDYYEEEDEDDEESLDFDF